MSADNVYDVTNWRVGNATEDVGEVINSIVSDVKQRQSDTNVSDGGKPGAVIYLPPGDYHLRTQVLIDVSFLRIEGSGHGFTSSSIRFNEPESEWGNLHELWPGGSRVIVDIPLTADSTEEDGAAFLISRGGRPRISGVEFTNFCIDGLHFIADGSEVPPENTYTNGKTGVLVASDNDSFRISEMGFVYLEHAVTIYNADALSIHDNFIAECGSCVELRGWGQASKITDNLIGAGFKGYSVFAENHGGLLVAANNIFPRGKSSIHFSGVQRSSITSNRLHSFYPGMVMLDSGSSENLVGSNHFLRDYEPWTPFIGIDNGLDDTAGLLCVSGDSNSIIGNHFSVTDDADSANPDDGHPVAIRLLEGSENFVSSNHVVVKQVRWSASDSCYAAQVDALLTEGEKQSVDLQSVVVDPGSTRNVIIDSGTESQVHLDKAANAFRATPSLPN